MRLNTEGQLTTGEWCNDKDPSGSTLTVQWCTMGTVNGPWQYIAEQKQLYHTGLRKCLGLEPESGRPILRNCDTVRDSSKISLRIFHILFCISEQCIPQVGLEAD